SSAEVRAMSRARAGPLPMRDANVTPTWSAVRVLTGEDGTRCSPAAGSLQLVGRRSAVGAHRDHPGGEGGGVVAHALRLAHAEPGRHAVGAGGLAEDVAVVVEHLQA